MHGGSLEITRTFPGERKAAGNDDPPPSEQEETGGEEDAGGAEGDLQISRTYATSGQPPETYGIRSSDAKHGIPSEPRRHAWFPWC